MQVTIEFPDTTLCATVSFVYIDEDRTYKMCCSNIDSNDFRKGYVNVPRSGQDE